MPLGFFSVMSEVENIFIGLEAVSSFLINRLLRTVLDLWGN